MSAVPGGAGFTVNPGALMGISSDTNAIAEELTGPTAAGLPEGYTAGDANGNLFTGGALGSCTSEWEAHLRDTASRVQALGAMLNGTATTYQRLDGNAAGEMPLPPQF